MDRSKKLSQIISLHESGKLALVKKMYEELLVNNPEDYQVLQLYGLLLKQVNRYIDAEIYMRLSLRIQPNQAHVFTNLANLYLELDRLDDAFAACDLAIKIDKKASEAYYISGLVCSKRGDISNSINFFMLAIEAKPNHFAAWLDLGIAYHLAFNLEKSYEAYIKAFEINSNDFRLYANMPILLLDMAKYEDALEKVEAGLKIRPNDFSANLNASSIYYYLHDYVKSINCLNKCLQSQLDNADANWNLSEPLIASGLIKDGWQQYEWRWKKNGAPIKRPYSYAWWQGESLNDKTILVWGEQGLGDEILFANCFNDLIAAAKKVVIECDARLVSLFARSFPKALVIPRLPEPQSISDLTIDYQIPAGSLPKYYRNSIDEFPKHDGYLKPNAEKVHLWKSWLDSLGQGLKVGISWRSMLRGPRRHLEFTELKDWGQILEVPGVVFVNLQYDQCEEEILFVEKQHGVKIHRPPNINLKDDLDDVSALTRSLDLVISAPTSVRAMSGALGVKTWELKAGDWITLGLDNCPWLPSVKPIKNKLFLDDATFISKVSEKLKNKLS